MKQLKIICKDGSVEEVKTAIEDIGAVIISTDVDYIIADVHENIYDEVLNVPGIVNVTDSESFMNLLKWQ